MSDSLYWRPPVQANLALWLGAALIAGTVACGGGNNNPGGPSGSSGSGGSGSTNSKGTMTAVIDGVAYTGIVNNAVNVNNLNIASNNADRTRAIAFAVTNASVGTFTVASGRVSMTVQNTNGTAVTGVWVAALPNGTGTVTISSLSASSISGTFSFTAQAAAGFTGNDRVVTNGVFSATF